MSLRGSVQNRAGEADRAIGPRGLAVGDGIAIVTFAVLGLLSHSEGVSPVGVARNAGPILAAWFLLSLPLGTYRPGGRGRFLATWLLAVGAGVTVRSVVLGHPTGMRLVLFGGVVLAATLVLLLTWRGLAVALDRRSARRRSLQPFPTRAAGT